MQTQTGADLRLSRYVVASDALSVDGAQAASHAVYSTRSGALITLDARIWALLKREGASGLPAPLRSRLAEAEILVPADEDELAQVVGENQAAIRDTETLYQVVQPTAWCQLGCGYCGQAHAKRQMNEAAQEAFVKRVAARLASGRYRRLKIGWFGAEPLVGLGVIRKLTPSLRAVAQAHGCGYGAQIVTNGFTLTPALAAELVEQHEISEAEVTLDGLQTDHDARRPIKGGAGSFHKIFENVRAVAAATDLKITIRSNVDAGNAAGVPALIEALADAGLAGKVGFYTSPVYAWGNDAHKTSLTPDIYAEHEMQWLALQLRLGFNVGLVPPRRKIVCLSVQREGEVVDAYGETFNCTEVPYVPAYGTPSRYRMDVPQGSGEAKAEDDAPFALRDFNERLLAGAHPSCRACPMLPVCGGHCPKAWEEGHAPCPSTKLNIRHRLNLAFALSRESALVAAE